MCLRKNKRWRVIATTLVCTVVGVLLYLLWPLSTSPRKEEAGIHKRSSSKLYFLYKVSEAYEKGRLSGSFVVGGEEDSLFGTAEWNAAKDLYEKQSVDYVVHTRGDAVFYFVFKLTNGECISSGRLR